MQSRLMDVAEAARILGIAPKTLYKWIEQGRIPVIRIGRLVRFREGDLERWIEEQISPGHADNHAVDNHHQVR